MRPIPPPPKPTKEEEPKFISICNRGKSSVDSNKTNQGYALLVKEEATSSVEIHKKMKPSLEGCNGVVHDKLRKYYHP